MARKRNLTLKRYQDKRGQHRARVFAGNGEQLARTPRGYDKLRGSKKKPGLIDDLEKMLAREHDPEVYRDKSSESEWRWRWRDESGRSIMIGTQGHASKSHTKNMGNLVLDAKAV